MAVFTRPVLGPPAILIGAAALWRHRRDVVAALAGAAAVGVPLALYNVALYGSLVGAYSGHFQQVLSMPLQGSAERAFWLMFSPSRGVLWFEPVVALTLVLAVASVVRARDRAILVLGIFGFATVWLTYSRWETWWGGHCFGPRYMTDALPMWFVAVAAMGPIRAWGKKAALVLGATGALVTAAYYGDNQWSDRLYRWFPEGSVLGTPSS
jgi:hypothetical protein